MKIADKDHPFYRPLWRRVALAAVTGGWAAYEIAVVRDPMWMVLTGGVFAYVVWTFLITFPKAGDPDAGGPTAGG